MSMTAVISAEQQSMQLNMFSQQASFGDLLLTGLGNATDGTGGPQHIRRDEINLSPQVRHDGRTWGVATDQPAPGEMQRDLLATLVELLSGKKLHSLQAQQADTGGEFPVATAEPEANAGTMPALQEELTQTTLATESSSLQVGGSIKTADGAELSFSLKLEMTHALFSQETFGFQAGSDGEHNQLSLAYGGMAAELSSTSFSFSLSATEGGDGAPIGGHGRFELRDLVKDVRSMLKPLIKDAGQISGYRQDWSTANQKFHAFM